VSVQQFPGAVHRCILPVQLFPEAPHRCIVSVSLFPDAPQRCTTLVQQLHGYGVTLHHVRATVPQGSVTLHRMRKTLSITASNHCI